MLNVSQPTSSQGRVSLAFILETALEVLCPTGQSNMRDLLVSIVVVVVAVVVVVVVVDVIVMLGRRR